MQHREPGSPDLLVSRRQRINYAAAGIQVAERVTVIQNVAVVKAPGRGQSDQQSEPTPDRDPLSPGAVSPRTL